MLVDMETAIHGLTTNLVHKSMNFLELINDENSDTNSGDVLNILLSAHISSLLTCNQQIADFFENDEIEKKINLFRDKIVDFINHLEITRLLK